jgi:hypothetical protein
VIPELLKSIAGSVVRFLLTGIGTYLVSKGVIKGEDAEMLVAGAGVGIAALAWSLWEKYKSRLNFLAALSSSPTATEAEVREKAKAGGVSVLGAILVLALLPATMFSTACSDDQLKTIATNVDRVGILIKDGREIRDELEAANIIGPEEGKRITVGLLKVNAALKTFNTRAKTYTAAGTLTPEGKADLKKLADDIAGAATELVSNGTFGVKNPDAQVRINSVIGSLRQVTLTIADTVALIKTKPSGGQ